MSRSLLEAVIGYGRVGAQPFYEKLHRFAMRGMNYGLANFETSGELTAMRYIQQHLRQVSSPVLFDVGANVGEYSLSLDKVFGSVAKVYAFEPLPATFDLLVAQTAGKDNIACYNFGFGIEPSETKLFHGGAGSTIASLYPQREDHGWRTDMSDAICINTVDAFCNQEAIKQIDFLKIDIEGHEFQALQGAHNMLETGTIRYIQFEFGPRQIDSRTYFRDFYYLLHDNYTIYRVVKDGLYPIAHYSEYHELFGATTNYVAEHR